MLRNNITKSVLVQKGGLYAWMSPGLAVEIPLRQNIILKVRAQCMKRLIV